MQIIIIINKVQNKILNKMLNYVIEDKRLIVLTEKIKNNQKYQNK